MSGARTAILGAVLALLGGMSTAEPAAPFAAVGVLGERGPGGCSATLIEPDVVLTAAHCVPRNGSDPTRLVFKTGGYPSAPRQVVGVVAVAFHPIYLLNLKPETRRIRFDLALVRLEQPVDHPGIEPLALGPPPDVGERVFLASYRGGRGERARERPCETFVGPKELVSIACEVDGGESGAPLLMRRDDGFEVVAVLSSKSRVKRQPVGFAPVVLPRIEQVMARLPEAEDVPPTGTDDPPVTAASDDP